VIGGSSMIASLGMALGPAAGGWIFDTFDGYGYLYIGSFGIGLAAVAMALAFPPLPVASGRAQQPRQLASQGSTQS
jgi:MFS family permease